MTHRSGGRGVLRQLTAVASDLPLPLNDDGIRYVSHGAVLVIGPAERIVGAAQQLARTTYVVACGGDRLPPGTARANPLFIPCRIRAVNGHLGRFHVDAEDLAGNPLDLAPFSPKSDGIFDLVLDLSPVPLLTAQIKPPGYFSPPPDELVDVLAEMLTLKGSFRKSRFVNYDVGLCAHGAQGIKGCTRCLGVCPAQAIVSVGDRIEVDAHLCHGCSTCMLVCPTGALMHGQLPLTGLIEQLASEAGSYGKTDQRIPKLTLCEVNDADNSSGQIGQASLVLPAIAAAGMETWLAALAFGFPIVALKFPADLPEVTRAQLLAQAEATRLLLAAIGLEAGRLITADDADSGFGALPAHVIGTVRNKRQLLNDALDALQAVSPANDGTAIDLPRSASFGNVEVDRSACTLCMSCSNLCPTGALQAGTPAARLEFIESRCVQCGICAACCPEDAIRLQSRFVFSFELRRQPRLLNESKQHACPECGNPFINRILLEKSMQLMRDQALIDEASINDLQFCPACRVRRLHCR